MRRREFIALTGSAAAWPFAVAAQQSKVPTAQQGEPVRRVGILNGGSPADRELQSNMQAFEKSLQGLGWISGRNLVIDTRWSAGDESLAQTLARELLVIVPNAIVTVGIGPTTALHKQTQTVPVVFVRVSDAVGQGLVTNLARPGGNITGFTNFEPEMAGKWLQTLKELAPGVNHFAIIANPAVSALDAYFHAAVAAAESLTVEVVRAPVGNVDDIEREIAAASAKPGGGLVVIPDGFLLANRALVIAQALKYRLPAIYPFRSFATDGGLVSYTVDTDDELRGAAAYVDRIFRGEKPGDLPVQAPSKFKLVINLKTAKILGLKISESTLTFADEVIE